MSSINLNKITLVALTGLDREGHEKALEKSQQGIAFGATKLIWDDSLKSIDDWNKAIIYDLPKYIDTEFALLVHADGYVINPESWSYNWLEYDYIGAPWPLPQDDYSYRDEEGNIVRVGNSVGLRSKKLMDLIATREWKSYFGNTHEDGFIACHNRKWLESQGCKFAPLEEALWFSKEATTPENKHVDKPFMFHKFKGVIQEIETNLEGAFTE